MFHNLTKRQTWVAASIAFLLIAIPLYVLQKSLVPVGTQVQPRYILPLLIIFTGITLLPISQDKRDFSKSQMLIITLGLGVAFSLALHFNIRRYVTGEDINSPNLNSNIEWWWSNTPSPMAFWLMGSISFGILLFLLYVFVNKFTKNIEAVNINV
jgi:drug/metabolite transporter (DMT)-like permease